MSLLLPSPLMQRFALERGGLIWLAGIFQMNGQG